LSVGDVQRAGRQAPQHAAADQRGADPGRTMLVEMRYFSACTESDISEAMEQIK
jgi:hypothetical protein